MGIGFTEIIILSVTALLCFVAYIKWQFGYWKRRNVPFIEPSFPMGNFEPIWAVQNGIHETMQSFYDEFKSKGKKHGGVFSSLRPIYIPIDLDYIKNILVKDFQHFTDRGVYFNEKHDPLSVQLFRIEGEKWRTMRNRLTSTFSSGKMKSMFYLVLNCGEAMGVEIKKLCDKNQPLDIKEMSASFTTNVIGTCVYGLDCNCFENPNNEFRMATKRLFGGNLGQIMRRYVTNSFPDLCRKLGVRLFPKETTSFFTDVIKKILDHRVSSKMQRNDFIDLLLQINEKAKSKDETLSLKEMIAQAFVFFVAGFETSSSTMTFALYEMCKHQDIQQRVREEVRKILALHDGKITYESVAEMTYMEQVFDETLRKYPALPTLDRLCTKEYNMPGTDLVLRKGEKVMIPLMGIHHDPEYYPDPHKFDPERFTPELKKKRHPCAYMPFGEGPRNCIGLRFGLMQAKIGMAILLKDYEYTLNHKTPEMKLDSTTPMLLAPLGDVLLDVRRAD